MDLGGIEGGQRGPMGRNDRRVPNRIWISLACITLTALLWACLIVFAPDHLSTHRWSCVQGTPTGNASQAGNGTVPVLCE